MSDANFGYGNKSSNEYYPDYAGIDWYDLYTQNYQEHEAPFWFEASDELGDLQIQCTQENTVFYLNRTAKEFDVIVITDPRDDGDIYFTRADIGDAKFDAILSNFFNEVAVVNTKYPLKTIAENIMRSMEMDVEVAVSLPEEWE